MSLPEHITTHSHVTDFLTPLPQDHFLQDTLFEKIRSLAGESYCNCTTPSLVHGLNCCSSAWEGGG